MAEGKVALPRSVHLFPLLAVLFLVSAAGNALNVDVSKPGATLIIQGPHAGCALGAPTSITRTISDVPTDFSNGRTIAVGDLNGDGVGDLIVGAPFYGDNHQGAVYVIFGKNKWPAAQTIDLATTTPGLAFYGGNAGEYVGHTVAAGDFNGDHIDDLMIGAPGAQGASLAHAGRVYIIYGSTHFTLGTKKTLSSSKADYTILGQEANQGVGFALAAGDFNHNGRDDCAAGGPYLGAGCGKVFVQFGRDYDKHAVLDLALHYADVEILGIYNNDPSLLMGMSVAAGDISGDNRDDLAITAGLDPRSDMDDGTGAQTVTGAVYSFRGHTLVFESGVTYDLSLYFAPYEIYGASYMDCIGLSLALGDVNGDGRADFVLGSPKMSNSSGHVMVVYSPESPSNPWLRNLAAHDPGLDLTISYSDAQLGYSCATGDLDHDGYADLLVGAPYADPLGRSNAGEVTLLVPTHNFNPKSSHLALNLSSIYPRRRYQGKTGSRLGTSVALGDVNGDGNCDVIMAAPYADPHSRTDAGEVYLFLAPGPQGVERSVWSLYK